MSATAAPESLLDQLRAVASNIDPQFQPAINELPGLLAALIHYTEHGDKLTDAKTAGDVQEVLAPGTAAAAAPPAGADPAGAAAASDAELEARISDLQAQLASRQATAQRTTVEHEPGVGDDDDKAKAKGKGK